MSGCPRWRWGGLPDATAADAGAGGILAVPTESSYGLAVDPGNAHAVAAVFSLKGREGGKPLPVVVGDVAQAVRLGVDLEHPALAPLIALWPAPLTLIVPLNRPLAAAMGSGRLAIRIPAHRRLRELMLRLGTGLTATSLNLSGEPPVIDPEGAAELLVGTDSAVVDDGRLRGGEPSTIVELHSDTLRLSRPGAFPVDRLPSNVGASGGVRSAKNRTRPRPGPVTG